MVREQAVEEVLHLPLDPQHMPSSQDPLPGPHLVTDPDTAAAKQANSKIDLNANVIEEWA